MRSLYTGNNVTYICGLGNTLSDTIDKNLYTSIKKIESKYIYAITANLYQPAAIKTLRKLKFKPIITFLSSHGYSDQTLTLWVKKQERSAIKIGRKICKIEYFPWNCSVSFRKSVNRICTVITQKKYEKSPELIKLKFKNVKNCPIWFRVQSQYIVKNLKD